MKLGPFKKINLNSKGFGHVELVVAVIVVAVIAVAGVRILTASHAATGSGILSLSPSVANEAPGSTFSLTVDESSVGSSPVNGVQANLVYNPSQLQYVSSQCSSTFSLSGTATGGNGLTNLACAAVNTSYTGTQDVGTVTFKVIGTGTSTVTFNSNSSLLQASNQTNIWDGTTTGATLTLAPGTATLALSPTSKSSKVGTQIQFKIAANSGAIPVNGVQANLIYNKAQLQYVSTSVSGSPYTLCTQDTGGNGETEIACALQGTVTGNHYIGSVTFEVIGTGTSVISFGSNSSVIQTSNATNIWDGTTTGATLTLAPGTATLALSPSRATETVNNTMTLSIVESTTTANPTNTVEADLNYNSSLLQYVSSGCGSTFNFAFKATGGSGNTNLICIVSDLTYTGTQTVGTVTFKVIGAGIADVGFDSTSAVEASSASSVFNAWNGKTATGIYKLVSSK